MPLSRVDSSGVCRSPIRIGSILEEIIGASSGKFHFLGFRGFAGWVCLSRLDYRCSILSL
jgi:hypothetical protein